MDISSLNATIGIIGSLSGTVYLIIFLKDRLKDNKKVDAKKGDIDNKGILIDDTRYGVDGKVIGLDDLTPRPIRKRIGGDQPPQDFTKEDDAAMTKWWESQAVQTESHPLPKVVAPTIFGGTTEFVKNEQAYQDWLKQHPQGFVINTHARQDKRKEYTALHKASCSSISRYSDKITPGAYTERDFIKVCADDTASLAIWAVRNGRNGEPFSAVCGLCKPPIPRTQPQSPKRVAPAPQTNTITPLHVESQIVSWTPQEFAMLLEKCHALPPAEGNYIIND